jgi:hypothetical protein
MITACQDDRLRDNPGLTVLITFMFVILYWKYEMNLIGDLDVASTLPVRELARKWRD